MPQTNYQKQLDLLLTTLSPAERKPKLLLHACCGPCSSYVLEYLFRYFDITIYYYNPNIYPLQEYERRRDELKSFYTKFAPATGIKVIEETYNPEDFYTAVQTRQRPELATEPEKGERCRLCYKLRLQKSYEYASSHNFDYFCTTLSISPFKDAEKINTLGAAIAQAAEFPKWLPSDFKKKGGFKRSLELSEEYGLYRQQYCGCIYSTKNH